MLGHPTTTSEATCPTQAAGWTTALGVDSELPGVTVTNNNDYAYYLIIIIIIIIIITLTSSKDSWSS